MRTPPIQNDHTDRVSTWEEIKLAGEAPATPGGNRGSNPSFLEPVLISPEVLTGLSDDELMFLLSLVDPDHRQVH